MIDHPGWNKAWLQYCRLSGASKEVVAKDMITGTEDPGDRGDLSARSGRLAAYASMRLKDPKYALRAWNGVLGGGARRAGAMFASRKLEGPDVLNPIEEVPNLSTNSVSQWCLNAIEVLEMAGDQMPEHNPLWDQP